LCAFVEAAQFDHLGVFCYSDEQTSASFHLEGKVDGRTISRRRSRILSLQKRVARQKGKAMIGQELPILVEGPSEETELLWQGRLMGQAAEIDGKTYINDFEGPPPRAGVFGRIRITEAHDYDLVGKLLPDAVSAPRSRDVLRVLQ